MAQATETVNLKSRGALMLWLVSADPIGTYTDGQNERCGLPALTLSQLQDAYYFWKEVE